MWAGLPTPLPIPRPPLSLQPLLLLRMSLLVVRFLAAPIGGGMTLLLQLCPLSCAPAQMSRLMRFKYTPAFLVAMAHIRIQYGLLAAQRAPRVHFRMRQDRQGATFATRTWAMACRAARHNSPRPLSLPLHLLPLPIPRPPLLLPPTPFLVVSFLVWAAPNGEGLALLLSTNHKGKITKAGDTC